MEIPWRESWCRVGSRSALLLNSWTVTDSRPVVRVIRALLVGILFGFVELTRQLVLISVSPLTSLDMHMIGLDGQKSPFICRHYTRTRRVICKNAKPQCVLTVSRGLSQRPKSTNATEHTLRSRIYHSQHYSTFHSTQNVHVTAMVEQHWSVQHRILFSTTPHTHQRQYAHNTFNTLTPSVFAKSQFVISQLCPHLRRPSL